VGGGVKNLAEKLQLGPKLVAVFGEHPTFSALTGKLDKLKADLFDSFDNL